jgi:hypothetical protein
MMRRYSPSAAWKRFERVAQEGNIRTRQRVVSVSFTYPRASASQRERNGVNTGIGLLHSFDLETV